jgi:hypothetical protein
MLPTDSGFFIFGCGHLTCASSLISVLFIFHLLDFALLALGGSAAVFAVNFTHPIETVKTRMQVSGLVRISFLVEKDMWETVEGMVMHIFPH